MCWVILKLRDDTNQEQSGGHTHPHNTPPDTRLVAQHCFNILEEVVNTCNQRECFSDNKPNVLSFMVLREFIVLFLHQTRPGLLPMRQQCESDIDIDSNAVSKLGNGSNVDLPFAMFSYQ